MMTNIVAYVAYLGNKNNLSEKTKGISLFRKHLETKYL